MGEESGLYDGGVVRLQMTKSALQSKRFGRLLSDSTTVVVGVRASGRSPPPFKANVARAS